MTIITSLPFVAPGPGTYTLSADLSVSLASGRAITLVSGCKFDAGPYSVTNTYGPATQADMIGGDNLEDIEITGGGQNHGAGFMVGIHIFPTPGQPLGPQNLNVHDGQVQGCTWKGVRVASANGKLRNYTARNIGGTTVYTLPMAFECMGNWDRENLYAENVWGIDPTQEMVAFSISQCTASRSWSRSKNLQCVNFGAAGPLTLAYWNCSDTAQPFDELDGLTSLNFGRVLWLGSDTPPFAPIFMRRNVRGIGYTQPHRFIDATKQSSLGAPDVMIPGAASVLVNQIPTMTGATTGGVTISGNDAGGAHPAWHVGDGTSDGYAHWALGGAGSMDIIFAAPTPVAQVVIAARTEPGSQQYAPASFAVLGSVAGAPLAQIMSVTGLTAWSQGERRSWSLPSPGVFTAIRINFNQSILGTYLQVHSLQLLG